MDLSKLVYLVYPVLLAVVLIGSKFYGRRKWNEEFMSLEQTKMLQGFLAICIMLHHIGQKTCASWLDPRIIIPGLELFVPIGYYFVAVFMFCSGYGLLKSTLAKEDYLKGFFLKRVFPLILAYYSTGIIFLVARILMKEQMDVKQFLIYLFGLQLSNPNTWYVICMPFLYLFFYIAFRVTKNRKLSIALVFIFTFLYMLLGTFINHNNWWMRGEWWYNSVHLFPVGILFAYNEKSIIPVIKKAYPAFLIVNLLLILPLYGVSTIALGAFSYYGENFGADHIVLRRWVCLVSQWFCSSAFVFSVLLLGMKIKIGNRFLKFMGAITLEFYLIHGLFVELFGVKFCDVVPSLYRIENVALFIVVVFVPSVPLAVLLQKFHRLVQRKLIAGRKN